MKVLHCFPILILLFFYHTSGLEISAEIYEWNFDTDPAQDGIVLSGSNDAIWVEHGGNEGGFLALTYAEGGQTGFVVFPELGNGGIVRDFHLAGELRVGNGTSERAADGFSISFARDNGTDPVVEDFKANGGRISGQTNFAGGIAEGGTTTGVAVSFDTWAGNTLPDGGDIEGIIVRVDNRTIVREGLPTRHGACDDITSLQTGPRSPDYWANGGDPRDPESWSTLCWQPFSVELTPPTRNENGKLTIEYKGNKVLDAFEIDYFPTKSRLILAGRTGGANEHTHFDNLQLKTYGYGGKRFYSMPPTGFHIKAIEPGLVRLSWDGPGPNEWLAFEIEKNGQLIEGLIQNNNTYDDRDIVPGETVLYRIRWVGRSGGRSVFSSPVRRLIPEEDPIVESPEISSIELVGDHVHIQFIGTLLQSPAVDGPFVPVPDAESSYVEKISTGNMFFKVVE